MIGVPSNLQGQQHESDAPVTGLSGVKRVEAQYSALGRHSSKSPRRPSHSGGSPWLNTSDSDGIYSNSNSVSQMKKGPLVPPLALGGTRDGVQHSDLEPPRCEPGRMQHVANQSGMNVGRRLSESSVGFLQRNGKASGPMASSTTAAACSSKAAAAWSEAAEAARLLYAKIQQPGDGTPGSGGRRRQLGGPLGPSRLTLHTKSTAYRSECDVKAKDGRQDPRCPASLHELEIQRNELQKLTLQQEKHIQQLEAKNEELRQCRSENERLRREHVIFESKVRDLEGQISSFHQDRNLFGRTEELQRNVEALRLHEDELMRSVESLKIQNDEKKRQLEENKLQIGMQRNILASQQGHNDALQDGIFGQVDKNGEEMRQQLKRQEQLLREKEKRISELEAEVLHQITERRKLEVEYQGRLTETGAGNASGGESINQKTLKRELQQLQMHLIKIRDSHDAALRSGAYHGSGAALATGGEAIDEIKGFIEPEGETAQEIGYDLQRPSGANDRLSYDEHAECAGGEQMMSNCTTDQLSTHSVSGRPASRRSSIVSGSCNSLSSMWGAVLKMQTMHSRMAQVEAEARERSRNSRDLHRRSFASLSSRFGNHKQPFASASLISNRNSAVPCTPSHASGTTYAPSTAINDQEWARGYLAPSNDPYQQQSPRNHLQHLQVKKESLSKRHEQEICEQTILCHPVLDNCCWHKQEGEMQEIGIVNITTVRDEQHHEGGDFAQTNTSYDLQTKHQEELIQEGTHNGLVSDPLLHACQELVDKSDLYKQPKDRDAVIPSVTVTAVARAKGLASVPNGSGYQPSCWDNSRDSSVHESEAPVNAGDGEDLPLRASQNDAFISSHSSYGLLNDKTGDNICLANDLSQAKGHTTFQQQSKMNDENIWASELVGTIYSGSNKHTEPSHGSGLNVECSQNGAWDNQLNPHPVETNLHYNKNDGFNENVSNHEVASINEKSSCDLYQSSVIGAANEFFNQLGTGNIISDKADNGITLSSVPHEAGYKVKNGVNSRENGDGGRLNVSLAGRPSSGRSINELFD